MELVRARKTEWTESWELWGLALVWRDSASIGLGLERITFIVSYMIYTVLKQPYLSIVSSQFLRKVHANMGFDLVHLHQEIVFVFLAFCFPWVFIKLVWLGSLTVSITERKCELLEESTMDRLRPSYIECQHELKSLV